MGTYPTMLSPYKMYEGLHHSKCMVIPTTRVLVELYIDHGLIQHKHTPHHFGRHTRVECIMVGLQMLFWTQRRHRAAQIT